MKLGAFLIILSVMIQNDTSTIFDCKYTNHTLNWYAINDGVMGGLSEGTVTLNDAGNMLYKGYVTTENNGGFSSVRHQFNKKEVSKFDQVILRVKGDGKTYQFRIKSDASDRYSYIKSFKTTGSWETIRLSFDSFYPSFRGNILDKPNYSGAVMEEIALFIGNKRKENFSLEISKIYLE